MLIVGIRVSASVVDHSVSMIWRRIERIQLHRVIAGIDDVVFCSSRNDYRKAGADLSPDAVNNRDAGTYLYAKELVQLVDFRADLLPRP